MSAEKLNSTTSLTPPAAAAAAAAPAAPAATAPAGTSAKTMSAPGPGEQCELCGHTRAESDEQEEYVASAPGAKATPKTGAAAAVYSVEDATETAQLCQIAKAPQLASAFISAKTPIAKVRASLAQRAADDADATSIDPTPAPSGSAEAKVASEWDDIVGKVNAEHNRANRR